MERGRCAARFPGATKLMITADCGGSNGNRTRLWKKQLQEFCNKYKMEVTVCHYPPDTSKWNKIEHKLFSFISKNWRGRPLLDMATVVNLIGNTKTQAGLEVRCVVDEGSLKKGRKPRKRRLKDKRGRGTAATDKPPIFGMIQRGGQVVLRVLENVQQKTIKPVMEKFIKSGSLVNTDEYDIYGRLVEWGYEHKTVCHSHGEYARDENGDGFYEVHVNTMEGFWSLLRSWLRPHRGVSQERLPLYVGFFQFVHNVRRRGKALLRALVEALVVTNPERR